MEGLDYRGEPRTVTFDGHPIHPMLMAFQIAFLVGALAAHLVSYGIIPSATFRCSPPRHPMARRKTRLPAPHWHHEQHRRAEHRR